MGKLGSVTHPGPMALGRSVVVRSGAEPPEAWADAPRIVVGPDALHAPVQLVEALQEVWSRRRSVVIELGVDPDDLRDPERYVGPVHALTPGFTFWRERLQFLVWANAYDARDGDVVWWHGRKVIRRLADEGVVEGGRADVTRLDGTPLWVDGGPPDPPDPGDGTGVVHRWTAEAGRLTASTRRPPEADLAPDQLAAVDHAAGPARVL
jgi:DNA helicase-2/ATP-dependent DNA helicase PcrA